jgi:hypothetical protein
MLGVPFHSRPTYHTHARASSSPDGQNGRQGRYGHPRTEQTRRTEPRTPHQPGRSAAERPVGPGASPGVAAAPVGMIDDVTATTPTAPAPAPTPQAPAVAARAVRRAQARDLTSAAAARWLTTEATTQLGRAITLSITRYARDHRQQPTWADALNVSSRTISGTVCAIYMAPWWSVCGRVVVRTEIL